MITETILTLAALAGSAAGDVNTESTIPDMYVVGGSFQVELVYTSSDGAELEAWRLGPAAFSANGKPLGARKGKAMVPLAAGSTLTLTFDLAEHLPTSGELQLEVDGAEPKAVKVFQAAPKGLNFMEMPVEDLAKYRVLVQTNRGDMLVEFLPDKAPMHVRNFLDLSYTGFYDGILFHRVSPTFMIQGGCPNTKTNRTNTWGTGSGPRMLDAEFNDTKHVRGTLSMARSQSPNSASCQFFVMSADSFFLDNQYSAFGRLVDGYETLDAIANAGGTKGRDGTVKPSAPQRIEKTIVIQ